MTEQLIIDVSSNQTHPIDWAQVKKAGVKGVILKATQGTNYVNPFFEEDLKGCNANKIPVMAYHFAAFGNVEEEVAAFTNVAGARSRALDIETSSDLAWSNQFIKLLQAKYNFSIDQTLLYGSASSIPRKGLVSLLWIADYGVNPGRPCVLWQYTQTGKIAGIANNVDLSRWTGTQGEFDDFFSVSEPKPVPKPAPMTKHPTAKQIAFACVVALTTPAQARAAKANGYKIFYWAGNHFAESDGVNLPKNTTEYASIGWQKKRA